jgi:predicted O-methyltransferase YrrM
MRPADWTKLSSDAITREVGAAENRDGVIRLMQALTPDPIWTPVIVDMMRGRDRFREPVLDVRSFLFWLGRTLRPRNYLEIGVRRGFSAAMVAAAAPNVDLYAFDLWMHPYADVANPGPDFVARELETIGHRGGRFFFSGNSHETVPAFFRRRPSSKMARIRQWLGARQTLRPRAFDLILVDGDHTLVGAYDDLKNVMGQCRIGGVVVFDDIAPDVAAIGADILKADRGADPNGHGDLHGVWNAVKREYPNYRYIDYVGHPPGVAIGIRMS